MDWKTLYPSEQEWNRRITVLNKNKMNGFYSFNLNESRIKKNIDNLFNYFV